ncbi:hypothetical protein [Duganella sp. P38]|uniref:hypothetical protein n=1 Tax=Duganella sp. P38 TaxID=3423949 RepID=UPI003D79DE8B
MAAALSCAALGAAWAQERRESQQQVQQVQRFEQREQRVDPRQFEARNYELRADEQRRAMQEASRNAEMSRRVGRMTPDERRDLRRQINEASQDLYSVPPKR